MTGHRLDVSAGSSQECCGAPAHSADNSNKATAGKMSTSVLYLPNYIRFAVSLDTTVLLYTCVDVTGTCSTAKSENPAAGGSAGSSEQQA